MVKENGNSSIHRTHKTAMRWLALLLVLLLPDNVFAQTNTWYGTAQSTGNPSTNVTAFGHAVTQYSGSANIYDLTAVGIGAANHIAGPENTAIGATAMLSMTTGTDNVAVGSAAMGLQVNGIANVAVGTNAMGQGTGGAQYNAALGNSTLANLSNGMYNVALGGGGQFSLTNGDGNASVGWLALYSVTTGDNNVAIGYQAGQNYPVVGSNNVFIGANSGANGDYDNVIVIGAGAQATAANQIILGNGGTEAIIDGNVTITGNLNVVGFVTCGSGCSGGSGPGTAGPAFSVYGSTTSIPNATMTKATFSTEEWDTDSNFASSRFTPGVPGIYHLVANEFFASIPSTPSRILVTIYKNGSRKKDSEDTLYSYQAGAIVAADIHFNGTTDYAEIYIYQATGSTQSTSDNGGFNSYFQGHLVRAD